MNYIIIFFSLLLITISPFFGEIQLDISQIFSPQNMEYKLFWQLRLPRVIGAFFTGATLGLSGLIFQSLFRNPMSTPFTLGVASGATLGVAFAIIFGFINSIVLFGFAGAIGTIVILFAIAAHFKSYDTSSLLLTGIALSFFYSAALMILFYISNQAQSYEIIRFTMGSLDIVGMKMNYPIIIASIALLSISNFYKKEIQLLLTSYENAFLKGLDSKKVNTILLTAVSLSVGVSVSITGPIGFVGLIIPHILKNIYKKSADKLILPTFFYSGVFLVFCDFIARNIMNSTTLPIGVVTSFIGGPFFIYLLLKNR